MNTLQDMIKALPVRKRKSYMCISTALPEETVIKLDALVKSLGTSRSSLLKVLVERALLDASSPPTHTGIAYNDYPF